MVMFSMYLLTFNPAEKLKFLNSHNFFTTDLSNEFILLYSCWFIRSISSQKCHTHIIRAF